MNPNISIDPVQAVFNSGDILPQILKHLPGKEIARSSAVSSVFRSIVKEDKTLRKNVFLSYLAWVYSLGQETKIPDEAVFDLIHSQSKEDIKEAYVNACSTEKTHWKAVVMAEIGDSSFGLASEIEEIVLPLIFFFHKPPCKCPPV